MFEFEIKNTYRQARTGFFNTPHGKLETPNLAIVATHGKIKLLDGAYQKRANPDLTISNTFHLFVNKKVAEIKKAGGLHKWSGAKNPIMTDSGGFQVFSLGWGGIHKTGKILKKEADKKLISINPVRNIISNGVNQLNQYKSASVKISENGVIFSFNGKKYELTPEKSIKIQQDLRADIIFAFDECTSPLHSYAYTKKAMERTHRWAIRSIKKFGIMNYVFARGKSPEDLLRIMNNRRQALFGIIQGGILEDLRKKSSRFIGALPFDGFGVGGCFGEKQMAKTISWSLSGLPEEKPRHLLGIGKIKDIFMAIKQGIDLFDCVVPTREARHGVLYTKAAKLNIEKGIFSQDKRLIEKNCDCWVCRQGITRQEIRHLFKEERLNSIKIRVNPVRNVISNGVNPFSNPYKSVSKAKRLASIHNIYFFKNLFTEIREAIVDNKLDKLEKEYYNYL